MITKFGTLLAEVSSDTYRRRKKVCSRSYEPSLSWCPSNLTYTRTKCAESGHRTNAMFSISFGQTFRTPKVFSCLGINKWQSSLTYQGVILKVELPTHKMSVRARMKLSLLLTIIIQSIAVSPDKRVLLCLFLQLPYVPLVFSVVLTLLAEMYIQRVVHWIAYTWVHPLWPLTQVAGKMRRRWKAFLVALQQTPRPTNFMSSINLFFTPLLDILPASPNTSFYLISSLSLLWTCPSSSVQPLWFDLQTTNMHRLLLSSDPVHPRWTFSPALPPAAPPVFPCVPISVNSN